MKKILLIFLSLFFYFAVIVHAQNANIQTCLLDNHQSYCQEYSANDCNSNCTSSCFPGRREDFSSCRIGTCFNTASGLCGYGSPRVVCENSGGTWYQQTPVQCNKGCCLIGPNGNGGADQARLTTATQCNNIGSQLGAQIRWESSIQSEAQCLSRALTQREGACVLAIDPLTNRHDCKRQTESWCIQRAGEFYEGSLCTNPQLNTKCEIRPETKCFDDEVYFVDSCGNKANIYDSSKISPGPYWNIIVLKSQSCSLRADLSNQNSCGNCNYGNGTKCGIPKTGTDQNAIYGQYVCKNLGCGNVDGKNRKHGESWCFYESKIGIEGNDQTNEERSMSVPGSGSYKKYCYEGEVRTEECSSPRGEICVQGKSQTNGFDEASCKENKAISCLEANEDPDKLAKCEENPQCFLKKIKIGSYDFDTCVPKYPKGYDFDENNEDAQKICNLASFKCKYFEEKNIEGRWKCKKNCECKDAQTIQALNNLCISLGDCGGNINLEGQFSAGYKVTGDRSPNLTNPYVLALDTFRFPALGQFIELIIGGENSIENNRDRNRPASGFWRRYERTGGAIIGPIFGVGSYREKSVTFTCLPWQPPTGGDNCNKCNSLGVGECNEYKCKSLGKTCEFLNHNDPANAACVNIAPDDASSPVITFNSSLLSGGFTTENLANGIKIKNATNTDGCLQEYNRVNFGISLDEPARCKISDIPLATYEEMPETYFDSSENNYIYHHNETTAMPTLEDLEIRGIDPNRRGEYNLYVRCEDKSGNSNDASYNIRFCVSPRNDVAPAELTRFDPASPGLTSIGAENFDMKFYTDEPAECRWSNLDENYDAMQGLVDCDTEITQTSASGWLCSARLNVTADTNNYYFRCLDQPWKENDRNENGQGWPEGGYVVQRTTTPLTVDLTSPSGIIYSATDPVTTDLRITTTGGIDNGKATCEYSLDNGQTYNEFYTTGESTHAQNNLNLPSGQYNIPVNCKDVAQNRINGTISFSIEIDNIGPIITRVYNSGNSLTVITNEGSICESSTDSCSFNFGNGTSLSGAGKVHTMPYTSGKTYRIKCKDSFENIGACLNVKGGY